MRISCFPYSNFLSQSSLRQFFCSAYYFPLFFRLSIPSTLSNIFISHLPFTLHLYSYRQFYFLPFPHIVSPHLFYYLTFSHIISSLFFYSIQLSPLLSYHLISTIPLYSPCHIIGNTCLPVSLPSSKRSLYGTPEEDCLRRDLTINSLFFNIHSRQVEDYCHLGLNDLINGVYVRMR